MTPIDRRSFLAGIPAGLLFLSDPAYATVYFTTTSVQQALFPSATRFVDRSIELTANQVRALRRASGTRVSFPRIAAFDAMSGSAKIGTLYIDRVYGKHEFITYAVALDRTGAVTGLEIMDYRESYGGEVRNARWRAQFIGRHAGQPLQLNNPIRNISGATLSCVHITDGVRRVLATHALIGL